MRDEDINGSALLGSKDIAQCASNLSAGTNEAWRTAFKAT
jgi:hypothetical protein